MSNLRVILDLILITDTHFVNLINTEDSAFDGKPQIIFFPKYTRDHTQPLQSIPDCFCQQAPLQASRISTALSPSPAMRLFRASDHHYSQIPLQTLKMSEVPRIVFQTPPSPRDRPPPVSILREPSLPPTTRLEPPDHLPTTKDTLPFRTNQKSENTLPTQIKDESENTLPTPVTHKYNAPSYPRWSTFISSLPPLFSTSQTASAENESILSGFTIEELEDLPPGFPYTDVTGVWALCWEFMGSMQRLVTDFLEGQSGGGKWGVRRTT